MRKIFTLAAAVLASLAINADVVYSFTLDAETHKAKNTEYAVNGGSVLFGAEKFETKETVYMYKLDGDPSESNTKYALLKLDEAIAEDDVITIDAYTTNKPADGQEFLLSDGRAATTQYASLKPDVKGFGSVQWTVPAGNALIGKKEIYISRKSTSLYIVGVKIESAATPSTDPELSVNPEEVTLALTAAKPSDEATVTFKGKNLAEGEYALNVPDLAGLSINPVAVSVGADGKLNQQVTIAYSSDIDVDPANTEISLKIGELVAKVSVNYSASLAKHYFSKSVNIEQLVLDNGVNFDIASEFQAANIEFENLNALDSLNDEKPKRNEPYLGLKLKKQGAFVACWLKEGDRIAVKFGTRKDAVKIGVNGVYNELEAGDESISIDRTAEQDEYLEIIAKTNDKTIVIKQIMLNEDIAEVILPDVPSAIDNIEAGQIVKTIENGQLVIIKNGVRYNAQGTVVK